MARKERKNLWLIPRLTERYLIHFAVGLSILTITTYRAQNPESAEQIGTQTMPKLLQIDFPFPGPFGDEMAAALNDLANSIAQEPGFIWKIWTENASDGQAGGIYLFEDEATANAYLKMHTERLTGFGVSGINAKVFDVNEPLSQITGGPLTAS